MKIIDAGNSLPPDRAFVIQLREPAGGQWLSGRVEHVVSGCARRFESLEELLTFMKGTVEQLDRGAGRGARAATTKRRSPPPAVIRFLSSRLGVRDRREAKLLKSA